MDKSLCDIIANKIPIISAPLGRATAPAMSAAVSEARDFGTIPLWSGGAEQDHKGVETVRALTDRNFAVNLYKDFCRDEKLQACVEQEVFTVSLFWGVKPDYIETAKQAGLTVFSTVGNTQEAKIAEDAGADVIVAQGWEAGGHVWGKVMDKTAAWGQKLSTRICAEAGENLGRRSGAIHERKN